MPRQNRGYKKGGFFRDSFFLIIACEGEKREQEYFTELIGRNQRIKLVVLIPNEEDAGKSAPKWVLDRAVRYEEEIGLSPDDKLWLVIDVDKWKDEEIRTVATNATERKNWDIAISNPCFEVWLLFHYKDLDPSEKKKCKQLKFELGETTPGGYNLKDLLERTDEAIERARLRDLTLEHFYPSYMHSKVYLLVDLISKITE